MKSAKQSKDSVRTMDMVQDDLNRLHGIVGNWRAVGDILRLPPGTLCSIAKGREPRGKRVRMILGLPTLSAAPVCPNCEVVHVGSCPNKPVKHRDLFAIPTETLAIMIKHREAFK